MKYNKYETKEVSNAPYSEIGDSKKSPLIIRNEVIERKISVSRQNTFPLPHSKSLAIMIGVLSAYGTGAIKGSQLLQSLMMLNIPVKEVSLPTRLLALPLIPFVNSLALHYVENYKLLRAIPSLREAKRQLGRQLRRHPLETSVTAIAALVEGMIVTNSIFQLLGDETTPPWYSWLFATTLGMFDASQYILLEGQAMNIRLKEGLWYAPIEYSDYLNRQNRLNRNLIPLMVHGLPTMGALLYTALAFIESRELIELMNHSSNADYREDMGDIMSLPFAIIYGGMQYALYGYRTQETIIRWLVPELRNSSVETKEISFLLRLALWGLTFLALGGSTAETIMVISAALGFYECWAGTLPNLAGSVVISIISGAPGFLQNFWVDGHELRHIMDDQATPQEAVVEGKGDPRWRKDYRLSSFLADLARIALLTLGRRLIQECLLPDEVTADEIDRRVTVSSYALSTLLSLQVWFFFTTAPALKPQNFHMELEESVVREIHSNNRHLSLSMSDHKNSIQSNPNLESKNSSRPLTPSSRPSTPNCTYTTPQLNRYEAKHFAYHQAIRHHRQSRSRLWLQAGCQLLFPVLIGSVLETQLRGFFTRHSHLNEEEALNNAQILGALFSGLVSVAMSHAFDWFWDRRDYHQFRQINQSLNDMDQKQELLALTQGLKGYSYSQFKTLVLKLKNSAPMIKWHGVVAMQESKIESLHIKSEDNAEEHTDEKKIVARLKREFELLKQHESGVLAYSYEVSNPNLQSNPENFKEYEYGFFYFYKETDEEDEIDKKTTVICYSPTNNSRLSTLQKFFLCDLTLQWLCVRTRTPFTVIDSGPWVIMQLTALMNGRINLADDPYDILRETNLRATRIAQITQDILEVKEDGKRIKTETKEKKQSRTSSPILFSLPHSQEEDKVVSQEIKPEPSPRSGWCSIL